MWASLRRAIGAAIIAALGSLWVSACTATRAPDMRDCGYSVSWNGRLYLGLIYVLHRPQTDEDVVLPHPGRELGHGFVPQCPGDSAGTPATVYEVPGVSSDLAVMAKTDTNPASLCIRQGKALPAQLLRHP